jgi:hypothetical protein
MSKQIGIIQLEVLKELLQLFIEVDGDLPDNRMHLALEMVSETLDDSEPDKTPRLLS